MIFSFSGVLTLCPSDKEKLLQSVEFPDHYQLSIKVSDLLHYLCRNELYHPSFHSVELSLTNNSQVARTRAKNHSLVEENGKVSHPDSIQLWSRKTEPIDAEITG